MGSSRIVLSHPPCKGQGEEEGIGAGHDDDGADNDDEEEDDYSDKSGIGDNRSGSSGGEICPPAILTPLEALTPHQTNVIGFYLEMYLVLVLHGNHNQALHCSTLFFICIWF